MHGVMLDYAKVILQKVSFDVKLFMKELRKVISWLLPDEIEELKIWLKGFTLDKPELRCSVVILRTSEREYLYY